MKPPKPGTGTVLPTADRRHLRDCELGDRVEFADGTRAVLTARISGAPFGRMLEGGAELEFQRLDDDASVTRLWGWR